MSFEDEVIRYMPNLTRYAKKLTRDPDAADDLVQTAVLRALQKKHLYQKDTNFRAWVFTILYNTFINISRIDQKHNNYMRLAVHYAPVSTRPLQISRHTIRDLERALTELPKKQREPLIMAALDGFKYEEIAEIKGIPIGTVRSRMARGRETLRETVER